MTQKTPYPPIDLAKLRILVGHTQQSLAEAVHLSQGTIRTYERSPQQMQVCSLLKIAEACRIDPVVLFKLVAGVSDDDKN